MNICWNDVVQLYDGRKGIVKFVGPTDFTKGIWYGLYLPRAEGKNDGIVSNRKYFTCPRKNRGLFVKIEKIAKVIQHSVYSRLVGMSARVKVKNRGLGTVKFIGETCFGKGIWYGIELDDPNGLNNGSIKKVSYFRCDPNHGVFVREKTLTLIKPNEPKPVKKSPKREKTNNFLDDEKSEIIMWKCGECFRVNQSEFLYCPICGRSRDDNNPTLSAGTLEMCQDTRLQSMSELELRGEIINLQHQLSEARRTINALLENGLNLIESPKRVGGFYSTSDNGIMSPQPGHKNFVHFIDEMINGMETSDDSVGLERPKLRMIGQFSGDENRETETTSSIISTKTQDSNCQVLSESAVSISLSLSPSKSNLTKSTIFDDFDLHSYSDLQEINDGLVTISPQN